MISEEEFQEHVQQFVDASNRIKDGWFLDTIRNQTFIRKKSVVALDPKSGAGRQNSSPALGKEGNDDVRLETPNNSGLPTADLEDENVCEEDNVCMSWNVATPNAAHYEYHILFSHSYGVPVLYLNVFHLSGQRMSLDEVWDLCPDTFQPYLHDNKWTTLTQQEHPLLGIPFLMLHPCHTADLMTQVTKGLKDKGNYLMTWLSSVGPLVGLNISEKYEMLLKFLKETH